MLVKTHLSPITKDDSNKGSSGKIAEYLSKENEVFFSHTEDGIPGNIVTQILDKHATGGLGKNDTKWFSPMYAFSQEECEHIVELLFDKSYKNYDDLSEEEKIIYNNYIVYLARKFQDAMAENFKKDDLGIVTGADLLYYGVVENNRAFQPKSLKVIGEDAKFRDGESKGGFNTHIHIIQSRKANNPKKSKISPEASMKSNNADNLNNKSRIGFDRTEFFNKIENTFDQVTKYNRPIIRTFEYQNSLVNSKKKIKSKSSKPNNMKKEMKTTTAFLSPDVIQSILNNASLIDYFFSLSDRGLLKYEGKRGNDHVFNNLNQDSGSIHVSEKGWNDFSSDLGGQIIKAVMHYEKLPWIDSVKYLKDHSGFIDYEIKDKTIHETKTKTANIKKSDVDVLSVKPTDNKYIIDYFRSRGISRELITANVLEVKYKRNGKIYYSGGIENIQGSYNVRSNNFKSVIGEHNDISIIKGQDKSCIIFEGLLDYLSYLELNNITKLDQNVIVLNSTSNFSSVNDFIENNGISTIDILVNGDKAGNKFAQDLKDRFTDKNINDLRETYQVTEKADLNDILTFDQVKSIVRKGYGL